MRGFGMSHFNPLAASAVRALAVLALTLAAFGRGAAGVALAAPRVYYLDCAGSDTNTGLSPSLAWKSLTKANTAALAPGDSLLLKRGCTFTGTLKTKWVGTALAPITISAYGSGALPKIQNSAADLLTGQTYTSVDITGTYLIVEYLQTTVVNPPVDPNCGNNPVGFFVGFNFRNPSNTANGGSYNVLRYSQATFAMAGVHFNNNTHDDKVLYNTLTDNNAMNILTPKSVKATDDIGAWGILLKGRNHEIAYNYFSRNNAVCTYDTPPQGNSVEVYEAQNSTIHHNTSVNDRVFSELGGSAGFRASGITYAYNLVVSNINDARFIVPRGSGNGFGPTNNTAAYHNTVYFTGAASQGIVCGAGCGPAILTARNNILWAEQKAAYADAPFTESNNLYWDTAGTPYIQGYTLSASSRIADPRFVANGSNFNLQVGSPAVNLGTLTSWLSDLNGLLVPQGLLPDAGAYELAGATAAAPVPPAELLNPVFLPAVTR